MTSFVSWSLLDHIKYLYEQELYEDAVILCSVASTLREMKILPLTSTTNSSTQWNESLFHYLYGSALYEVHEFQRAEHYFKLCSSCKRPLTKPERPKSASTESATMEFEAKYKQYLSCLKRNKFNEAFMILETIQGKQRTPKINMALGLYYMHSVGKSPVSCFKEVLRQCPLSLEAIRHLCSLGVKSSEISNLVLNQLTSSRQDLQWLPIWLKAEHDMYPRDRSSPSFDALLQLNRKLANNGYAVAKLAEGYFLHGRYSESLATFKKLVAIDSHFICSMDIYAFLLWKHRKAEALDRLACGLLESSEDHPETWIALGFHALCSQQGRSQQAHAFAEKSCKLSAMGANYFGLLLQGFAALKAKGRDQAIEKFSEAVKLKPYIYEAHQGVYEAYAESKQTRQATMHLMQVVKAENGMGTTSRSLTLLARSVLETPMSQHLAKAKTWLEKAIKLDSQNMEAVRLLAELLARESNKQEAIKLIEDNLKRFNDASLRQVLAQLLRPVGEEEIRNSVERVRLELDDRHVTDESFTALLASSANEVEMDSTDQ